MPEFKTKTVVDIIKFTCENCFKGELFFNGDTMETPNKNLMFGHYCSRCKMLFMLSKSYPCLLESGILN
jgi:hypothetical protein